MLRKQSGELEWLQFELLAGVPELTHALFLRHGGVSKSPYATLNFSLSVGDSKEAVEENRSRAAAALGLSELTFSNCCHGKTVVCITEATSPGPIADGLVTDRPGLGLTMTHADCQVALIYDPIHRALANVHCGWRGNAQNIYREAIELMKRVFHSSPKELLVGISPSLGPKSAQFINWREELPPNFAPFRLGKDHFDLWAVSEEQLLESGVKPNHIEIARIDTNSHQEDFFSYRRDGVTGRNAVVAAVL